MRNPGGLWDASSKLYPFFNSKSCGTNLEWKFPSGAKIKFAHMEHEKNRFSWQGSEICLIGFDELTHFTWNQFIYMLSRNRSTTMIKPRIKATTNPDPDSWVRKFIDWWIDSETGYAIPERSGEIRWFVVNNNETYWSSKQRSVDQQVP